MSKPAQSEAPIKFASASVVKALFVQSVKTKEETATIAGRFGERVKTQVENGNLHNAAFGQAAAIYRKMRNNELKAKEHVAHLRHYIDLIEEEMYQKGHTGNLDDQAKAAATTETKAAAPVDPNTVTAPGGLPHDESLVRFEANLTKAANQKKAAKVLEIPALDPDAPPAPPAPPAAAEAAAPAEKPKRGRTKAAATKADAAPPPPPAIGGLSDDDEETSPAPRAAREEAPGTFAQVH